MPANSTSDALSDIIKEIALEYVQNDPDLKRAAEAELTSFRDDFPDLDANTTQKVFGHFAFYVGGAGLASEALKYLPGDIALMKTGTVIAASGVLATLDQ